jgi:hypothetical protein
VISDSFLAGEFSALLFVELLSTAEEVCFVKFYHQSEDDAKPLQLIEASIGAINTHSEPPRRTFSHPDHAVRWWPGRLWNQTFFKYSLPISSQWEVRNELPIMMSIYLQISVDISLSFR